MTYALKEIGGQLQAARDRRGLTQRAIADMAGTSQARISHIENGEKDVRFSSLIEYARLLDLEIVLVPRQSLPAVKALIAREPLSPDARSLRTALGRLQDLATRLNAREPEDAALTSLMRTSRELQNFRLKPEDITPIKSVIDTLKRIEQTPARINTARAMADILRNLRNERAHDLSEAVSEPRPAYSLDDDDA